MTINTVYYLQIWDTQICSFKSYLIRVFTSTYQSTFTLYTFFFFKK